MAYDLAKVTDAGNNLVASILANKSSLSIDKIEVSDTQLPSTTDITKLTSIPNVVQTIQGNGFSKNDNTLIISSVLDNSKVSTDYKAWVFGVWGSDLQNGKSILMAVITSTTSPDTIPAYSGSTPVSYTYKFNIGFSNAGNVQFNMINGSFATNDTVVHTTGDETIDGQKKFKTDPTDSAGNAYAKTVDVNQQLDKKVNAADMRKPANDVAGLEEVNAKQDKIGYTPADDSKVVHDNHDGTITADGTIFNLLKSLSASSIPQDPTKDYNTLPQGLALMSELNGEPANMPPVKSTYLTLTIASNFATGRKRQLAWLDAGASSSNNNYTYIRYCVGNTWSSWDSIPTSSKISSLIPSSIADTTKLANFTAGLQSGGVSVATSDDLKSVENSAWHSMTGSSGFFVTSTCLYKINTAKKRIELIVFGGINQHINYQNKDTIVDLSSIISGITSVDGQCSIITGNIVVEREVDFSGTKLIREFGDIEEDVYGGIVSHKAINDYMDNDPCYVYYTGLV